MNQQLANFDPSKQLDFSLTVLNGKDKGAVYKLIHGELTLGRDKSCDIVIKGDDKASREHATVEVKNNLVFLRNISSNNIVFVNDEKIDEAYIDDRCVITLGRTKLKLKIKSQSTALQNHKSSTGAIGQARKPSGSPYGSPTPQITQKSKLPFYIAVGFVVLLGYFLSQDSNNKKEIETEQTIEQRIESLQKKIQSFDERKLQQKKLSPHAKAANAFFIKGFRDYKQGQYVQSFVSFQACLGHVPNHPVCSRYLQLAKAKSDEILQYEMNLGRKRYQQGQYDSCISIFRNIMFSLKDSNSSLFTEAKKLCQLCEYESNGRYKCRPN